MPSGSCRRGPVMLAIALGPHWQGTLQTKSLAAGTLPGQAQGRPHQMVSSRFPSYMCLLASRHACPHQQQLAALHACMHACLSAKAACMAMMQQ